LKLESQEVYKPLVTVNSIYVASLPAGEAGLRRCELTITDNGPGIPDSIKDKIFQPFFTTKPTGQGTGLGLSLAYDIVKAHGGKLNVHSTIDKGTEFVIQLPI
jgi:signal transduction histidine kinase